MSLNRPSHQIVATVLGAGTMGAQIAAHLANAGVRTHLLDIVPKGVAADAPAAKRNAYALSAIKTMLKGKPAPYMDRAFASRITPGNLDDDLEAAVANSDLVVEAVIERLDIKRPLFDRLGKAAPAHAILATNTSGLPIGDIVEELPDDVAKRVVGMHWFNPPRYMHLLEIVPSAKTDPAVAQMLGEWSDRVLGKGVVPCRDTPNFIGNRIGVGEMMLTNRATFDGGYTVEEVDLLNGALMGRPKTGSFRLGDLVGVDVAALVTSNLARSTSADPSNANYDELHDMMVVHPTLEKMFDKGLKGDKTGQGFYKKTRDDKGKRKILSLDLNTLEYRDRIDPVFPELKDVAKVRDLAKRVHAALRAEGRAGDFLRKVYLSLFNYSANRVGAICDGPKEIDDAMRWGYGWKQGVFWLWDAVGLAWSVEQMKAAGIEPSKNVLALLDKQGAEATWFVNDGPTTKQWIGEKSAYVDIDPPAGMVILKSTKATAGAVIDGNDQASLIDLGDGVACVEFHSKMNSLNAKVVSVLQGALTSLEERGDFRAIVIGNQASNFSAGADLFSVLAFAGQSKWDELDTMVHQFQQTSMRIRHGALPVVVAPHHLALGGGCEFSLHGAAIVADAELYMGLVEAGVGLLPAGGGLKEICRRASDWAAQVPDGDPYPFVRRGFLAAAQAEVAKSAFEAKNLGYLQATDGIVFNSDRVVAEAKRRAISLAEGGWQPPDPNEPISVVGAARGASFMLGAQMFNWGGYASDHDMLIGQKIGHVLSGGMAPTPTTMTAQQLLDLEREAFVSLCGEQKTKDRIAHMLSTGKPLRN